MKLNTILGSITSIEYKPGDRNPNVKVAHVTMNNGLTFTAVSVMDGKLDSEHFPTPFKSVENIKKNTEGVLFFGNRNGYKYPTFVGFIPTV